MAAKKRRRKNRRRRKLRKRIMLTLMCVLFICVIGGLGYAAYLVSETPEIDPSKIYDSIEMTSFVYDADGNEIDKLHYAEDREYVPIKDIPEITKNAFIAIEDKTFYSHHGFNFRRMLGAVLNKLLGRSSEISGTSTITQQLARNVFLADVKSERTLKRKFREMVYAHEIEQALSKDDILEAYLNTIYLGYGCYGIESAAETYFGKKVTDLSLSESAALAALPQAPDEYALIKDEESDETTYLKKYKLYANDLSKGRRDLVLDLMSEQGYITVPEAEEARVEIADILRPTFGNAKETGKYTYFTDYLAEQVAEDLAEEYSLTEEKAERLVHTGGYHIYSTIDPDVQDIVYDAFSDDNNFPYSSETPQAAMVITEVGTGKIVAMQGGRGATGKKLFNRATSPRQPGSSIKPLSVYSAALQKSYEYEEDGQKFHFTDYGIDKQGVTKWGDYITAGSTVVDEKMTVNGNVWPQNFSRTYSGNRTFRTALQQSLNTCAVKIQMQVGTEYSMEMLKKYGITTAVDDSSLAVNDLNSAAMALGAMTYGTTPLEMALAYSTFPNDGVRNTAMAYTKVVDSEGNTILTKGSDSVKVLDPGVAWIMTDCLKSNVSKGIAGNAAIYGVQVGGKTGTTNDTADFWFCGFTPKYSAALWIGTDQNSEMSGNSSQAAALWSQIMRQVPGVTDGQYSAQPANVIYKYGEYYTSGTVPSSDNRYTEPKKENKESVDDDDDLDTWLRNWDSDSDDDDDDKDDDESIEDWYREFLED